MGHAHIERQAPPTHPQANTHELMHDAAKNAALSHLNAPRILRVSYSGFPFFFFFFGNSLFSTAPVDAM